MSFTVKLVLSSFCLLVSVTSNCCSAGGQKESTPVVMTSPDQAYTVQLTELIDVDTGGLFPKQELWLSVFKNGVRIIDKELFYQRDAPRFSERYPSSSWIVNNVLRFGAENSAPQDLFDEVKVSNQSNRNISYLIINIDYSEVLLVLDLQPGETVKFNVYSSFKSETGSRGISVAAHFANNSEPALYKEMVFRSPDAYRGVTHYCMSVKSSTILIGSVELDGEFENKVVAPRSTICQGIR